MYPSSVFASPVNFPPRVVELGTTEVVRMMLFIEINVSASIIAASALGLSAAPAAMFSSAPTKDEDGVALR